jgi:hypothetical protein
LSKSVDMSLALQTKLEAVNSMLSAIGEAPINSLDQPTVDSSIAQSTLNGVIRSVQSHAWHFNNDKDFPLARATDNTIPLSNDILRIDVDELVYPNVDVVQRSGKLYDKLNHTYTFTQDLKAEIVRLLDWDDLPQPFRTYCTAKAARIFQQRMVGSGELGNQLQQDELTALANLKEFEMDTADYNVFGVWDVARVMQRR